MLNIITLTLALTSTFAFASTFPTSYEQSRSLFRGLVNANTAFKGTMIEIPSRNNEDLTVDVAYSAAKAVRKKLVVVSAGVHGVESPAGSVMIQELLSSCMSGVNQDKLGIVLIHSLNPYGFKHSRRFNENNVDLNRNCFDHAQAFPGDSLANPAYEKIKDMYHRDSLTGRPTILFGMTKHLAGEATITASLAGQYRYPEGIYYGGSRVEPECAKTQEYLSRIASEGYESVMHLDIHTGLGESGLSQIMVNGPASESEVQQLKQLFPSPSKSSYVVKSSDGTDTTIANHGDFTRFLCGRMNGKPCLAATVEIGALGGLATLAAIINENVIFQYPARFSDSEKFSVKETLRDTFILRDLAWRNKVRASAQPLCEAIKKFSAQ